MVVFMNTIPSSHYRIVGYLLWLFGFMGAHRFYFGKRKTALLMAILSLCGLIPFLGGVPWFLVGLWWLVDLFLIGSMDRVAQERFAAGPLNYTLAWILVSFLGWCGVHRFYQGKIFTGLIYLCTGGLLGVGWMYDFWTLNQQVHDVNVDLSQTTR
jgi:TM2 domain-containing membrane protein YozV